MKSARIDDREVTADEGVRQGERIRSRLPRQPLARRGAVFPEMPRGDEKMYWLRLHAAVGVLAFAPLLFRIGWRVAVTSLQPLSQPPVLQPATPPCPTHERDFILARFQAL